MYLVSIYFDDQTNQRIQQYINQVAERTGNHFMLEGNVPPHITVSAFETKDEERAVCVLQEVAERLQSGTLQWASVGQFLPYVIFLAPVLNGYLHEMSQAIYDRVTKIDDVNVSPYYQPFQWLPHTTVGKKLTQEEMQVAFELLQGSFGMFSGEVTEIGLAKTNPYRDIVRWKLNKE